jgi:hypothetical protein
MDRAEMFCQLLATKLVFYDLGDFQIFQLFKFVLKFEFASKPEHFELDSWREKPFPLKNENSCSTTTLEKSMILYWKWN